MSYVAVVIKKATNGYIISGIENENISTTAVSLNKEGMIKEVTAMTNGLLSEVEFIKQDNVPTKNEDDE